MPLSIRNPKVEELARTLAAQRGESITEAIQEALEARLADLKGPSRDARDLKRLAKARSRFGALPDLDWRGADGILGYDEAGLPS
jgi:Uncharacterized protein conserved in bacteria